MVCAILVKEGKTFEDVIEFFEKATNTVNTEIDYKLAHEKKVSSYQNLTLMQLMLGKDVLPHYHNIEQRMEKAQEGYILFC